MTKVIGIGKQSFEDIIQSNCFYIDKTSLIKEWWESEDDITLITRPRRFGKTLNMDMLKCFFSNQYRDQGQLFEGLNIWKEEKYQQLQGTYPVIYLSFADVKQTNYKDAVLKIKKIITDVYQQYIELAGWEGLTEVQVRQFQSVDPYMDDVTAQCALKDLSGYLYRYYEKKVIILLDEFDTPMQEAYIHGYWNEFTAFIRNILVLSIDPDMTIDVTAETKQRMVALTSDMTQDWMMHAIYVLQEAAAKIAYTTSKRVMLEIAIIKLCKTEMRYDIEGIQARIESLEQQLAETKELLKEQQAHPVVMAVAPPATEGAGTVQQAVAPQTGDSSEHIKQNLRDKYPQAEYEDLLLIAKAWKTIGKRGPRLVQHYYRQASLVAGRESGALELVVADTPDNDLAISYFANQDKLDELSEQLTDMAQCKVRVTFRKIDGREEVHELQKDWDLSRIVFDDIEMHE